MRPSLHPRHSIAYKPLVSVTLVAVIVVGSLLGFLLWSGHTEAFRSAETNSRNLAWILESRLDTTMRRVETVIEVTANTFPRAAAQKALVPHYAPRINPELDAQLRRFPELGGLRFYDANGDLLYSSRSDLVPRINIADRAYFQEAQTRQENETVFSKVIVSRINGRQSLVMARPVRDDNGQFLGIVSGVIDLGVLQAMLRSIDVGEHGLINIRRTDDFSLVLRQPERAQDINTALPRQHPVVQALLGNERAGTREYVAVTDKVLRIWSFRRLADYPFYTQVALAHQDVRSSWYKRTLVVIVISLASLALLVWLLVKLRITELNAIHATGKLSKQASRLQLMANVFEHSGEAIVIANAANRIIEVNRSFTEATGYTLREVRNQDPNILDSGRTTPDEFRLAWHAVLQDSFWQGERWLKRKDGSIYPARLAISVVRDQDNTIAYFIGSFTDISAQKSATEQIHHLAHHDTLTNLSNRYSLQGRLEQALAAARRSKTHVAVLFIDLDRFKDINDTLGHHIGDGLLVEVAKRLRNCARETDVVTRQGGDEFVVVLVDVQSVSAAMWANKVLKSLSEPYHIEGHELSTSASIGVALSPEDGDDMETLMKHADAAMYHAKQLGRNNVQFFTESITQAAVERLMLAQSMNHALEQRQFILHYQPQVDLASGRIVSVEALVRWQHPDNGLIPPDKFIPIAEETGFIEPLGEWVLNEALRQLAAWRHAGVAQGVRMAVNLSVRQLRMRGLPDTVHAALAQYAIQPADLELEITESVAMLNPQSTIEILGRLRAMGVELAIDDFGTGYSSLSYLKLLPIHRLKLDRAFVRDVETDPSDSAICSATIAMAHSLSLSVVAEGVETASQRDYLGGLGCDIVQGYLFSRPLPAADMETLFRSG